MGCKSYLFLQDKGIMRAIFLTILLLLFPVYSLAETVNSKQVRANLDRVPTVDLDYDSYYIYHLEVIRMAIDKVDEKDFLSVKKREILARSLLKAEVITGIDWRLLLAITKIESSLCLFVLGDKKKDVVGTGKISDYNSFGCMQVHWYWWGKDLQKAGLTKKALLDYETGIIVGATILKKYIDIYGWNQGIVKYNGSGPAAREYAKKVLKVFESL